MDMLDSDSFPLFFPPFDAIDPQMMNDSYAINFPSPFAAIYENSLSFSSPPNFANLDEFKDLMLLDHHDDHFPSNQVELELEELPSLSDEDIDLMKRWLLEEISGDDQETSHHSSQIQPLISNFPSQSMEIDHHQSLHHLSMAFGEAMETKHMELAEVIAQRISEKVSPIGDSIERALFYLFGSSSKELEYLIKESSKNFDSAFEVLNQIFPYAMFCHFTANSAILEAMPRDYYGAVLRIFDFDIGEGLQWSYLIETLGQQRGQEAVKVTSIKWPLREDYCSWRFEETKARLEDHARENGINLEVYEVELKDLEDEVKKAKSSREWLAFNCMLGFPHHMGRMRKRSHAMEFLKIAEASLANNSNIKKGIITFGDGDAWRQKPEVFLGFGLYLENCIEHCRALLESMEISMPCHLGEARVAMEALFVAPLVSMEALRHDFEQVKEVGWVDEVIAMEGLKVSKGSLMEAKEMVREGEGMYRVRVEGEYVLVLEWRQTPLIRISSWS